jgi:hypothetical protein
MSLDNLDNKNISQPACRNRPGRVLIWHSTQSIGKLDAECLPGGAVVVVIILQAPLATCCYFLLLTDQTRWAHIGRAVPPRSIVASRIPCPVLC